MASGRKNLKKYNVKNVKLVLSDGLENITETYDVITISGMGTSTILKILNNKNLPNNLIISSNNDLHLLRKSMNEKGYTIKQEDLKTAENISLFNNRRIWKHTT